MTHYYALVIVPADGDLETRVGEAMDPYDEDKHCEKVTEDGESWMANPVGMWDWWQIGGRWTGTLDGWDPEQDPRNIETCKICGGTGTRDDALGREMRAKDPTWCNGCNGCHGKGRSTKWPTAWARHPGDVMPAFALAERAPTLEDNQVPYAIITHGSESVARQEKWTGREWLQMHDIAEMRVILQTILLARLKAGLTDRVVVVDYHS